MNVIGLKIRLSCSFFNIVLELLRFNVSENGENLEKILEGA